MRSYATEFIGTFFLVFTVCCTVLTAQSLAPLAIAAVLTAMVFAGGPVSGGHYNPAVSLAVFIRGKLGARALVCYVTAQVAAAFVAAGVAGWVVGARGTAPFGVSGRELAAAVVVELLITFALVYVVLSVDGSPFFGLAIGFTVLAGAVAVGSLSGGAFNPAVGFGLSTAGIAAWSMVWVYVVATLAGGLLAAVAHRAINSGSFR